MPTRGDVKCFSCSCSYIGPGEEEREGGAEIANFPWILNIS
jgi:hypothetical protein